MPLNICASSSSSPILPSCFILMILMVFDACDDSHFLTLPCRFLKPFSLLMMFDLRQWHAVEGRLRIFFLFPFCFYFSISASWMSYRMFYTALVVLSDRSTKEWETSIIIIGYPQGSFAIPYELWRHLLLNTTCLSESSGIYTPFPLISIYAAKMMLFQSLDNEDKRVHFWVWADDWAPVEGCFLKFLLISEEFTV